MMATLWQQTLNIDMHRAQFLIEYHFKIAIHSIQELDSGWQNRVFLVNEEMVFRFPKQELGMRLMEKEIQVVPYIQQHVHFPISAPIWTGRPSSFYSANFAGYPKIEGVPIWKAFKGLIHDKKIAKNLAAWLLELHQVPFNPALGLEYTDFKINVPLRFKQRLDVEKYALYFLDAGISLQTIQKVDEKILECQPQSNLKTWGHGDIFERNVLYDGERLSGIIDFGDVHIGHPAVDFSGLMMFDDVAYDAFLSVYPFPDASTESLMLIVAYFHSMNYLPYCYIQKNLDLIKWSSLFLRNTITHILKS